MCQVCRDREAAAQARAEEVVRSRNAEEVTLTDVVNGPEQREITTRDVLQCAFDQVRGNSLSENIISHAYAFVVNLDTRRYGSSYAQAFFEQWRDPVVVLERAQSLTDGAWGNGILSSALAYVRDGKPERLTEFHTEAFFENDEELTCVTGKHELKADGEQQCRCMEVEECGCPIDPDDIRVCGRCSKCMSCCEDDGDCFTCEGCGDREDINERCSQCEQCDSCCSDNGECFTCQGCERRQNTEYYCSSCETCTRRCCSCWHCGGCSETFKEDEGYRCGECERCEDCCECIHCGRCGENCTANYCSNCERCGDCCIGDDDCLTRDRRPGAGGRFFEIEQRELRFHESSRTQFKLNTLRRHISVEMEVDGAEKKTDPNDVLQKVINKWGDSVVEDGSLSGWAAHEVNTQPTNGDRFLEHIKQLCDGYKAVEASCSADCGLHVHINCKDLSFYDMRKVLAVYARTERALFGLCAQNRLDGSYSKVCGYNYLNMSPHPSVFKRQLLSFLYVSKYELIAEKPKKQVGERIKEAKSDKADGLIDHSVRYRALNIHSFFHRGSIEFRHHEGTVDYDEIINWSMVCGHLIESATRMSEAQIMRLPVDPHEALLAIVPAKLHEYMHKKWQTKHVPASIFEQEHKQYGRVKDAQVWMQYRLNRGTLPPAPGEPSGVKRCASCNRVMPTQTNCSNCGFYND